MAVKKTKEQTALEDYIAGLDVAEAEAKAKAVTAKAAGYGGDVSDAMAEAAGIRTQKKQAQKDLQAATVQAEKDQRHAAALGATANRIADSAEEIATNASSWAANLPTYGGIAAVLLALMFFIWVIVPVGQNGETRAQLLYLTLTGKTKIAGEPNAASSASPSPSGPQLPGGILNPQWPGGLLSTPSPNGYAFTPDFSVQ